MIRIILHSIVSLVLLISSMGFSVSRHYCGGDLVEVSFNVAAHHSCSSQGGTCETDGCCRNETQTFQLHENVTPSVILDHLPVFRTEIPDFPASVFLIPKPESLNTNLFPDIYSPPPQALSVSLAERQSYLL